MRLQSVAFYLIAGLLLVGCTDQSSIMSSGTNPVLAKAGSVQSIRVSSVFDVDQVVYDTRTGESYIVAGQIFYEYSKDQAEYVFTTTTALDVIVGDVKYPVAAKAGSRGKEEGDFELVAEYAIPGFPPESKLQIQFGLSGDASIQSISIETTDLEEHRK